MRISDWSSDVCSSDLCAPYTRSVAEIASIAAERRLHVIAVTDTPTSPLVPPSRHAFFIPHASSYFSNSMGAYIVFCEALLNLVAREMGPAAPDALSRREHLIAQMKVELRSEARRVGTECVSKCRSRL